MTVHHQEVDVHGERESPQNGRYRRVPCEKGLCFAKVKEVTVGDYRVGRVASNVLVKVDCGSNEI